jgi:DNA mismatch endonuclease (patch repair protein)
VDRSENMRRIKGADTKPEILVRHLVTSLGYRYRLRRSDVTGKPDLAFIGRKKAIFVHGCFWHSHSCKLSHVPKSNTAYWDAKLARNRLRDSNTARALKSAGWRCLVIWECELKMEAPVRRRITKFLA